MSRNESQRTIFMMFSPVVVASVASGRRATGDLVEGRTGHLVGLHLRRTVDNLRQRLEHAGVCLTGVRICAVFQIPHADADRVHSARGNEGDLVLKALLLAEHGDDVLVDQLSELCRATGLEMERNTASKHGNLQGWRAYEGKPEEPDLVQIGLKTEGYCRNLVSTMRLINRTCQVICDNVSIKQLSLTINS